MYTSRTITPQTSSRSRRVSHRLLLSIEEERAVLGAALLDQRQAEQLIRLARLDDFVHEPHQFIFAAMCRLGPPLELNALAGELDRAGQLDRAGGWSYLTDLDYGVVAELPMSGRLARLHEMSRLRALRALAQELEDAVHVPLAKSGDIIARLRDRLEVITR